MKNKIYSFFYYILLTFLTLVIFSLIYQPWQFSSTTIPFDYRTGDEMGVLASFKGVQENGWIYQNKFLSAPFGQITFDYPSCDFFLALIVKILLIFTGNIFATYNIFFILTFLLASYTSFFIFNKYKISKLNSLAGSLLFSFSAYHLYRGQQHLFLSAYFLIPIIIDIVLQNFKKVTNNNTKEKTYKLISLILISSCGIYYAFYSCLFLFFSGLISSIKYQQFKKLITTFLMIGIIFIGVITNFIPSIIYQHQNGKNSSTAQREAIESDYYGLRIIQLFIPPSEYPIPKIAKIKSIYMMNRPAILVGEDTGYLGIIGIIGFILLLSLIFFLKKDDTIKNCSYLLLVSILYGVVSGFGTIFSYVFSPEIRSNNRISIIINFICLLGLFLLIEKKSKKILNTKFKKIFCFLILLLGLLDQTVWRKPNNLETKKEFLNDQNFTQKIEQIIPENSKVYQLPYKQYPETPFINKIGDYDLFKPYLFSLTTSWSYGAVKGRIGDAWNQENINLSTNELINKLIISDFNGIYIDRFGYLDNGEKIEKEIENITLEKPIISDNQRLSFFNLSNYKEKYIKNISKDDLNKLKEKYLYPISLNLNDGCYNLEKEKEQSWYWCQQQGSFDIFNYSNANRLITLEFDLNKNIDPTKISFFKKENNENLKIISSKISNHYLININIKPGQNKILFKTNLNQVVTTNDPRILYFQIFNLKTNINLSENYQ